MCGIFGVYSPSPRPLGQTIELATAALSHRGPDGRSKWLSPDGHAGLGHARLAIIDLETGTQPILNESGRVAVAVNGELYGFEALQRALVAAGHTLRTRSDSEVALHLYEDLGTACLSQLRGEFAFVLYDGDNQTLVAARDRFGIKPLYYAHFGDTVLVASEAKALFAAGVEPAWSLEGFFDHLHLMVDPGESLFHRVRQVPPGHLLLATAAGVRLVPYWDLEFPEAKAGPPPPVGPEHAERMRAELTEAVRLRLRADVPVACYLSGGLDSAAILATAARLRDDPVEAFTLRFDDPAFDEGPQAEAIARHVGARFHPVQVTESMLADAFADAVWHSELPAGNLHGVAKFLLSGAVQQAGFKVVLTGEGSDELLGGYLHFRRDMFLHGMHDDGPQATAARLAELERLNELHGGVLLPTASGAPNIDLVRAVVGFAPSFVEAYAANGGRLRGLLRPSFLERHRARDPWRHWLDRVDVSSRVSGREPMHRSLYLWLKSVFPTYVLNVLGDRMEMAHSIEGRTPFLDHRLAEAVAQMPAAAKVHGTVEKYVLREAVADLLPAEDRQRVKRPFVAPAFWEREGGRFHELLQDGLRSQALGAQPFFEPSAVRAALDALPRQRGNERRVTYHMLNLVLGTCVLQERYRPV